MSLILFALFAASAFFVSAQDMRAPYISKIPGASPTPVKKPMPTPPVTNPKPVTYPTPPTGIKNKEKYKGTKTKRQILNENETPAEKSIAVNPNVVINLCVSEGRVRINGWERSEIRAYVSSGSELGFQVQQKDKTSGKPVWVKILGYDPAINDEAEAEECLSGEEIEIDVPRGASVRIKGTESDTTVESVKNVRVENLGGDIFLNDIREGIYAKTFRGGITVGKSSGAMLLDSSNGNIVAYEVSPGEIGDSFRAKTINGIITLQQIEHMLMEINSNSGSIRFNSAFLSGGQYTFATLSGSILLTIPEKSSCRITASYGGQFNTEIPLQNQKLIPGSVKNLTGQIGTGEAMLSLTTYSGRINIKKTVNQLKTEN